MRSIRHITPRYILDRLALTAYERRHPNAPWLTAASIEMLDCWLRQDDSGLEWGSGRSTVWLAQRIRQLVSVEEYPDWGTRVEEMVRLNDLRDRVTLHVVPRDEPGVATGAASPYARVAETIAPESLDFCLIDGDLRDHCALAAPPLLKPGGLLIVDNVERYVPRKAKSRAPNARGIEDGCSSPAWELFMSKVSSWRSIWTTNGVWDTALWVKPCRAGPASRSESDGNERSP